jgi:hypothetical protein
LQKAAWSLTSKPILKLQFNIWTKLPWLGGDVFSGLKQAGVEYEKGKGFKFTQSTNIRRATTILSEALGQKVEFEGVERGKPCFICGNPVQQKEEESERTLCDECMNHWMHTPCT